MNGVSVQMKLAKDLTLVQGDRVQLLQLMVNLIINAIEAMVRACTLRISIASSTHSSPRRPMVWEWATIPATQPVTS
jgi:C4-dicarboxylate-specific signal transduction histidine kinase